MPLGFCFRRIGWLFVVFLLFPILKISAAQATHLVRFAGAQARKHSAVQAVPPQTGEAPKPQLLNADSNPTLRYPVAVRESSVSCGWLDVTRNGVSYVVVESGKRGKASLKKFAPEEGEYLVAPADAGGSEEFNVSLNANTHIRITKNLLQITFAKRAPLLIYLSQDLWGNVVGKPRAFEELAQTAPMPAGTLDIQRAMQNFDSVLAEVKPPAPPPLDVDLHAEPSVVEKGRPVALVWTSRNATSLDLEPGVGRVAAAGGMSVLPQDSTNYTLTASGPAGTKSISIFVTVTAPASLPTIVLTEPSAAEGQTVEIASSPLTIRGVVMDASGIPIVTVNGKSVTLRPTSSSAAQFRSDPVDLQPGENRFEVSAINNSHGQTKVTFVAHFTASPPITPPASLINSRGLGKAEIISLLKGDVPSARVAELVKERGINFGPTPDDLKAFREAGGDDDLIDAINQKSSPARN